LRYYRREFRGPHIVPNPQDDNDDKAARAEAVDLVRQRGIPELNESTVALRRRERIEKRTTEAVLPE
jgi:hypothetical protein